MNTIVARIAVRFLLIFLLGGSLVYSGGGHDHGHGGHSGHGHDDHDHEDHEEERRSVSLTIFTENSELFLKFPVLVKGKESKFLAHMTHLRNSKPFMEGRAIVILRSEGESDESFSVDGVSKDGIFTPVVVPKVTGLREVTLYIQAKDRTEVYALGKQQVYLSESEIPKNKEEKDDSLIAFLKEQVWKAEFQVLKAGKSNFHETLQVPAKIVPASNSFHRIQSPVSGRVKTVYVEPLQALVSGQQLVKIEINETFAKNYFDLLSNKDTLIAELDFQKNEVKRFEKLVNQESASQTELQKIRLEARKHEIQLNQIEAELQRLQASYSFVEEDGKLMLELLADAKARVIEINVNSGQWIESFQELLIARNDNIKYLEIYLPLHEQEFSIESLKYRNLTHSDWMDGVGTFDMDSSAVKNTMDEREKVAVVSMKVLRPESFKLGQNLELELKKGKVKSLMMIPRSAISVEQGNSYIYVQIDGEHYERRAVKTGIQSAEKIEVLEGLAVGERIVVKGAYNLRMAGSADQVPAHGHAH